MKEIIENYVNSQEIIDKSVTIIHLLNDKYSYTQYFAVPNNLWTTISLVDADKNLISVHGNSISKEDAVNQVNSAIEKAKTNPDVIVFWGKFYEENEDGRFH